jgi:hypothetical protein
MKVQADTKKLVANIDQEVKNVTVITEAEIEKLKAEYGSKIATLDADKEKTLGAAAAEVTKMTETAKASLYQLKMDVFQNDSNAFLRFTLADQLNPNLVLRLFHSGSGTFWTNMGDKNMNLMLPVPAAADAKDRVKTNESKGTTGGKQK